MNKTEQFIALMNEPFANYLLGVIVTSLAFWLIDAILKSGKAGD